MIVSNIIGGLGNQMFQYASAYSLSKKLEMPLYLSLDQFNNYDLHNGYQLDKIFGVANKKLDSKEMYNFLGFRGNPLVRKILSKNITSILRPDNWFQEESIRYYSSFENISESVYLHGYWQSEKYFMNYENDIRAIFTFNEDLSKKDNEIINQMRSGPSVSIHIRRGDYTNQKNKNIFNNLEENYYMDALKKIYESHSRCKIFIFTDDPVWAKENIKKKLYNSEVISHNTGPNSYKDMMLMSNADHNIIANSSFSWWGAWLNQNPKKIVIAPKIWFIDDFNKSKDLIPQSWYQI
ncbi:alpha-1,2-fucosyltransferase [Gammaproteobacteria bacterium]|nr:alpha-1,2-fucosyltransferase [Gammaproteobacteria bacterium]